MEPAGQRALGRYALYDEIAAGGMATVHYGRLLGDVGFSRTVAIKRLHPHVAKDPEFASMFLDEARLAARIRHPNVVQTLDVVALEGELFLVMEYVHGESLSRIQTAAERDAERLPLDVVSAILCGALHGLHAAHEATNDQGAPLGLVHRDVSPQNILVGADGIPRVIDFGVAKASGRLHTTRDGNIKGKLGYMAPEQLHAKKLDRRADIFAAGVVLWEALTGTRLFKAETEAATLQRILDLAIEPPSAFAMGIPKSLDEIALRALQREPSKRFGTAREMALALEASVPLASATRVATWLQGVAGDTLSVRSETLARIEQGGAQSEPTGIEAPAAKAPRPLARVLSYALVGTVAAVGALFVSRVRGAAPPVSAAAERPVEARGSARGEPSMVPPPPPTTITTALAAATAQSVVKPAVLSRAAKPRPASPPKATCTPSFVDDAGIKQYRACP